MIKYVALLRGINVGGNKLIKMAELCRICHSLGLKNVKTYIQSGNILFESAKKDPVALTRDIEKGLRTAVGFEVPVVLRTISELETIVKLDPFKKAKTADAKFYVSFLVEPLKHKLRVPLVSPKNDCGIIHLTDREVFTVAFALPNGRSGESMMGLIEKEFGKSVTTRNWNTVLKLQSMARTASG
jgi:uncharacterized protein (DUF1697 family)